MTPCRIAVVDDNDMMVRNLVRQIEQVSAQMQVVYTAANGIDALQFLEKEPVDILFTDIKMPVMDGLALIEQATQSMPHLQCVIVSGYDDFQLAQQAIRLHVNEYLLKPVDSGELKALLHKLIATIDDERHARIQEALTTLLHGELLPPTALRTLPAGPYQLLVARQGLCRSAPEKMSRQPLLAGLSQAGLYPESWVVSTGFAQETVIVGHGTIYENAAESPAVRSLFACVAAAYPQINGLVSDAFYNFEELSAQYQRLSNALTTLITVGGCHLYDTHFAQTAFAPKDICFDRIFNEAKIEYIIQGGGLNAFQKELQNVLECCARNQVPFFYSVPYFSLILEKLHQLDPDCAAVPLDVRAEIDLLLYECYCYEDIFDKLTERFARALQHQSAQARYSSQALMEEIAAYMQARIYGSLTIQQLCEHFGFSPSYISRLFKKRFAQTPMDYYITLKVEEAKRLIEQDKDIYVKAVSQALGFSEQHYFSRVFKAYVGMSPMEYRTKYWS